MSSSSPRLESRIAMITGGAGSMGSATVRCFAAEGAAVAIADLALDRAEPVAKELRQQGHRAHAIALDVCSSSDWKQAVATAEAELGGPVDTLCNLAGSNYRVSFDKQTEQMWRQILDANLTANFLGTKAVIPGMRRAGSGVILHVGSLGSIRQGAGSPAYGVSKIGLVALTRSTAASYAADNIRCVLINPGHVDTDFIRANHEHSPNDWETSINNPANYEARRRSTPLGRLCTPEDVARTFLYAASNDASMITGSMITVDGGAGI
ncbi:MAG: SDR family oxidoreductase [Candidatus Latescibacterota bacterium]|nr:SDR family oxidoreductase [Candidatus Latescibacterota bacterium]